MKEMDQLFLEAQELLKKHKLQEIVVLKESIASYEDMMDNRGAFYRFLDWLFGEDQFLKQLYLRNLEDLKRLQNETNT